MTGAGISSLVGVQGGGARDDREVARHREHHAAHGDRAREPAERRPVDAAAGQQPSGEQRQHGARADDPREVAVGVGGEQVPVRRGLAVETRPGAYPEPLVQLPQHVRQRDQHRHRAQRGRGVRDGQFGLVLGDDHGERAELLDRAAFGVRRGQASAAVDLRRVVEAVTGLGEQVGLDGGGPAQPVVERVDVPRDPAGFGHGPPPSTPSIATVNSRQAARSSDRARCPALVSRYVRRSRPATVLHSLATCPARSSLRSAG